MATDTRCEMCFKAKQVGPAQPGLSVQVCKGCFYEIDTVIGFLDMAAARQQGLQSTFEDLGSPVNPLEELAVLDNPPTPPESTESNLNGTRPTRTRKPAKTS